MADRIIETTELGERERERLFTWDEDIFGAGALGVVWRPKAFHLIFERDGEAVSHVGLLEHEVRVGSVRLRVGGVGGVVTRPEAQSQGHAQTLMRRAAEIFADPWRVDFGFLFCFDRLVPFYRSLGWQIVEAPVWVEQPSGRIEMPINAMTLAVADGGRPWPAGEVELQSLPW